MMKVGNTIASPYSYSTNFLGSMLMYFAGGNLSMAKPKNIDFTVGGEADMILRRATSEQYFSQKVLPGMDDLIKSNKDSFDIPGVSKKTELLGMAGQLFGKSAEFLSNKYDAF